MIINLHDKNYGTKILRDLFSLTKDDETWIDDNLFNYKTDTPEMLQMLAKCFHKTEESMEVTRQSILNRSTYKRWLKEDAITIFKDKFGEHDFSKDLFTIRHISSSVDDGYSIKRFGLLKLTELLMMESPLSLFLANNGIEIDVEKRMIKCNGISHSLDIVEFGELRGKLYYYKGEIEGFICGEKEKQLNYGDNLRNCPEIILSIDRVLNMKAMLQQKWKEKRKATFLIEFDLGLSEFSFSFMPNADNQTVNDWVLEKCLSDMCNIDSISERYVALNGNVAPERLRMFMV